MIESVLTLVTIKQAVGQLGKSIATRIIKCIMPIIATPKLYILIVTRGDYYGQEA